MTPGGASIPLASDEEGYSLHQGDGGATHFLFFGFENKTNQTEQASFFRDRIKKN